jgi:hypothetical protein
MERTGPSVKRQEIVRRSHDAAVGLKEAVEEVFPIEAADLLTARTETIR